MSDSILGGNPSLESPVKIGIVTDIQYADKPDKVLDGGLRKYGQALAKTRRAVEHFNTQNLSFVIHLGDIVDGNETLEQTCSELDQVLQCLSPLRVPIMHVVGNHCLDVGREHLERTLGLKSATYYYEDLSPKWRIIILDTVDMSVARPVDHPLHKQAQEYLEQHAGDENANTWNGGLGPDQLRWLKDLLRRTAEEERYALVCGHHPLVAAAAPPSHLAFESEMITDLLHNSGGTVRGYFCGHYYQGGYATVDGVHHVTCEAILDSGVDGSCGVIELHDSQIVVVGVGSMTSRTLALGTRRILRLYRCSNIMLQYCTNIAGLGSG